MCKFTSSHAKELLQNGKDMLETAQTLLWDANGHPSCTPRCIAEITVYAAAELKILYVTPNSKKAEIQREIIKLQAKLEAQELAA